MFVVISERKGNFSFLSQGKGIVSSAAPALSEGFLPCVIPGAGPLPCRWENHNNTGKV